MKGTKSDFNIRKEGKRGPGDKVRFCYFVTLGKKGGEWQARHSLWKRGDVSVFAVENLSTGKGRKRRTEKE